MLGRVRAAVHPERVRSLPEELSAFLVSPPLLPSGMPPSFVLQPGDVHEVERLVGLAGEVGIGVVVASSTPPHSKGGLVCSRPHFVMDLSHWKHIDLIDRRNRVCRVEPGVTYGELLVALEAFGLTVPMPLAPRDGKSVLAAVMDREPSTWPNRQWDSADPLASTEVVFGTGEPFRTGAAGGPGSLEQQRAAGGAQKSPMGPSQTDFHRVVQGSQGTIGIVTWITLRAELRPSIERPFLIGTSRLEDLIPYIYTVQRAGLGEHSFVLDRTAAAMLMSAVTTQSYETLRSFLPEYLCLQNIAGFERLPSARVAYQFEDIGEIAQRHQLALSTSLGELSAEGLLRTATRPCGYLDWRHALKGHCLSIFFLSTLDRSPDLIEIARERCRQNQIPENGMGVYVQPVVQNHACHIELLLPFTPGDAAETERIRRFETDAVASLAEHGAFFSRPYGAAGAVAFAANPMNLDILKKVKGIFDPKGILNPGKWDL